MQNKNAKQSIDFKKLFKMCIFSNIILKHFMKKKMHFLYIHNIHI